MEIDDLLAVPPREFTAARNALVAELRRAGKSAEAATAKKLRKPTLPVWVVNQVARRHGADVKAFVAAADDLKRACAARSRFSKAPGIASPPTPCCACRTRSSAPPPTPPPGPSSFVVG